MSRKVDLIASAIVRSLKSKRERSRPARAPLAVAVASAVAQRLSTQGRAQALSVVRLSKRKTGRLAHPAARGQGVRPAPFVASALQANLSSRTPMKKSLASAVASAVVRRLSQHS
jgi:hypothetical protein